VRSEFRLVRALCALPPRLQRLIAGRPLELDGQRLASDIQVLLRLAAVMGEENVVAGGGSLEQTRAQARRGAAVCAGPPLPMAEVKRLEIPGPAGTIPARLYVPPAGEGAPGAEERDGEPQPLLVYYHGGGWVIGDLDTHDSVCRFLATAAGVMVLSVDYRLAPEHPFPAAVEDAVAAFRWAADAAAELGADPARIAVGGDSAGGNLAAAVSLLSRNGGGAQPAMQLLFYPATDAVGEQRSRQLFAEGFLLTKADMDWFEAHYLPSGVAHDDPRVSVLGVGDLAGLPPAYVITAGLDPLRDEGEAYAERMRAAGVRVALRRQRGLIHGFANLTAVSRSSRAAMFEAAGALRMGLG
jgi:acetyl esterase